MNQILKRLAGKDFRSIGESNQVVSTVLAKPRLFPLLFSGLLSDDPIIRMRAADAVEKITAQRPELIQRFKSELLERVALTDQQEVQWHVAQIIPRLDLSKREITQVVDIFERYLATAQSNIVRVMSLQALAELASQDRLSRKQVSQKIEDYKGNYDAPSIRTRAEKLIKMLGDSDGKADQT